MAWKNSPHVSARLQICDSCYPVQKLIWIIKFQTMIMNVFAFIFVLHNLKRAEASLFWWIATTTNIKTKKFGICFIVTGWCNKRNFFSQLINLLKLYFFPTKTFIKSDLIRVLALAAKHICVLLHFLTWNLMHAQWGKNVFWWRIFIFTYQHKVTYRIQGNNHKF